MLKRRGKLSDALWPLGLLAPVVWAAAPGMSRFGIMCAIALTLFAYIKLHMLVLYVRRGPEISGREIAYWFLLWPGLDAPAFFEDHGCSRPQARDWGFAITKTSLGIALLVSGWAFGNVVHRVAAGWLVLLGAAFSLHFGLFHLAALAWNARGRNVRPIMNWPIAATSVGDFWTHRWNLAFRDYASLTIFRPLARRLNPVAAVLVGFGFSGVIHEIAISVPAGGGYGLPCMFFLLQGVGAVAERAMKQRGISLATGTSGRLWTAAFTTPGAVLVFHIPFVDRVVAPMVVSP